MKLFFILLFIVLLIVGILWSTQTLWKRLNRHNEQLFLRCWSHEKFLMELYNECPESIQVKIEHYLNSVKPLD